MQTKHAGFLNVELLLDNMYISATVLLLFGIWQLHQTWETWLFITLYKWSQRYQGFWSPARTFALIQHLCQSFPYGLRCTIHVCSCDQLKQKTFQFKLYIIRSIRVNLRQSIMKTDDNLPASRVAFKISCFVPEKKQKIFSLFKTKKSSTWSHLRNWKLENRLSN